MTLPIPSTWLFAGVPSMMQSVGDAIGKLSSGFEGLLESSNASGLEQDKTVANETANDPASQLQTWGQKLFKSLQLLGWPAGKSIQLQLSSTGRLSVPGDPATEQIVQTQLQNSPEMADQLQSITDALATQYEMRSGNNLQNSPLSSHGQWHVNVSERETSWSWVPKT